MSKNGFEKVMVEAVQHAFLTIMDEEKFKLDQEFSIELKKVTDDLEETGNFTAYSKAVENLVNKYNEELDSRAAEIYQLASDIVEREQLLAQTSGRTRKLCNDIKACARKARVESILVKRAYKEKAEIKKRRQHEKLMRRHKRSKKTQLAIA